MSDGSNKKIDLDKKEKLTSNMWTALNDDSDEEDGSHLFDDVIMMMKK